MEFAALIPTVQELPMSIPLADRLAEYANGLRFEDLPKETVHETKRRFIDSIATAVRRRQQQRRVGDFRQRAADSLSRFQ
jgi:2-methylcitrate dehydratase PrpD